MSEVRIVDPNTGGEKGQKDARFDLIPQEAIWMLAEAYGRGAEKYSRWIPVSHDTPAQELVVLCSCESTTNLQSATPIGDMLQKDSTKVLDSSEILSRLSAEHSPTCRITKVPKRIVNGVLELEFDRNWERGYNWSLSFGALQRHLWQFWNGEDIDEETGTPHIVSVLWHASALATFQARDKGNDDRPEYLGPMDRFTA